MAADTDTQSDLYERYGCTTQLVAAPATGGAAAHDALYAGSSADGSHTFFITTQPLLASDTNGAQDVYDRTASGLDLISGRYP